MTKQTSEGGKAKKITRDEELACWFGPELSISFPASALMNVSSLLPPRFNYGSVHSSLSNPARSEHQEISSVENKPAEALGRRNRGSGKTTLVATCGVHRQHMRQDIMEAYRMALPKVWTLSDCGGQYTDNQRWLDPYLSEDKASMAQMCTICRFVSRRVGNMWK
ncbi:hypothetical protein NQZ68_010308 [Dissostichus eleginoides]|nr:hypothetical protein NQZ68_010308 [Dissostichus eleginoides]